MGLWIALIVFIGIPWLISKVKESSFDNYMPPPGQEVDHGKMSRDLARGVSQREVMNKTTRGEYNVPRK